MSVCRKLPDGTIQKIAGHTILLDANAAEIRSGTYKCEATAAPQGVSQHITFTDPMPDTDYVVIIEPEAHSGWGTLEAEVLNKTTTGFAIRCWFSESDGATWGKWTAFKPVKIEGYTELQNKVNNPDETPTIDSMNLVTSDGVARAIENASAVWKGTRAEWNALPATDKKKYDLAVLLDKTLVKAVDRETGNENDVADLTKVFTGTDEEWKALSTTDKTTYALSATTDRKRLHSVDRETGEVTEIADLTRIWHGTKEEWDALTDEERDKWDQAEIEHYPVIYPPDYSPDYSTEEHWTGKRWIDGKKIYSKVFTVGETKSISSSGTCLGITDVMNTMPIEKLFRPSMSDFYSSEALVFTGGAGNYSMTIVAPGASISLVTGSHIVIEYTKTTDD